MYKGGSASMAANASGGGSFVANGNSPRMILGVGTNNNSNVVGN